MGRAFATVVAERALEFSALADEALRLPEPFATRFLDGIRNALDQDVAVDWDPLLEAALQLPSSKAEPQPKAEEPRYYSDRSSCDLVKLVPDGEVAALVVPLGGRLVSASPGRPGPAVVA